MRRWIDNHLRILAVAFAMFAAGCSALPEQSSVATESPPIAYAVTSGTSPTAAAWHKTWHHFTLPGKTSTDYSFARVDGRNAVLAHAVSSASLFRQAVNIPAAQLDSIKFSWKVPELIAQADLAVRDNADSPARIILAFDGDRSRFSAKNAMLSELSHVLTGEPLPYATLMYVWSNKRPPGSVITSSRTDRIRKIVVESGTANLNQWLDYERNIRADFEKAFGEPPGALVGIGIMTDSDNTRTTARAWYGRVDLAGKR
jgi:Protein of unknown function (DUF3047)